METPQTNQGEQRKGPSAAWGVVAMLVIVVCLRILSHSAGCDSSGQQPVETQSSQAAPQRSVPSEPQLALLNSRGYPSDDEDSYYYVEGQVKNISAVPLSDIEVSVTWYTRDGQFITSDSALVKYNPILPGQVSPFEAITIGNPRMAKYSVEFQNFGGGTVDTLDLREQTAATATRARKEEGDKKAKSAADRKAFEKNLFQNLLPQKKQ